MQPSIKKALNALGLSALLSVVVFALLMVAEGSKGDKGTALGFIALASFLFVLFPLLLFCILRVVRATPAQAVLYGLLLLLVSWHLFIANELGFFDKYKSQVAQEQGKRENPALYELRKSFLTGRFVNISLMQTALEMGADPNASFDGQVTLPVLVVAASRGDVQAIDTLLRAGANPNARSEVTFQTIEQPTALDVVLLSDVDDETAESAMQLLIDAGASTTESPLMLGACQRGNISLFEKVMKLGVQHRADSKGNNCLHGAITKGQTGFVRALFFSEEHQPLAMEMLNWANKLGQNPLDLAAAKGDIAVVNLLLENNAKAIIPATQERIQRLNK